MIRRLLGALIVSLALAVSFTIALDAQPQSASERQRADRAPVIRLRAATFSPARGELPRVRPDLLIAGSGAEQRGYHIVQFEGPILDTWKRDVEAAGGDVLEYIPDFAFKVRMTPGEANRIARLPSVVWVGPFHPAYKLGPELLRNGQRGYLVRIERGADLADAIASIAATGAQILSREGSLLTVSATALQLDAMAHVLDVASVENLALRRKHNEFGGGEILGAGLVNANGFDGSTQTIAIADTGLGNGTAASAHNDLPASRIASIFNWPGMPASCFDSIVNDGAIDVDTGHGTHVATTALGSGALSGAGRGTAPAARLVFQAVENWAVSNWLCKFFYGLPDGYYLVGIPGDIGQLFEQGYNAGARVHSDSWGSDAGGAYTADSANADAFVWARRDMTITLSAGNAGTDASADGVVDATSMSAPATAKNVISVGASENDRQSHWECDTALSDGACAARGGANDIFTYGVGFPDRYTVNPLKDDPSAGNAEQMAAFSSRGPTIDGRIKPDVVAPGTWILSGYSDKFQQHYDASPNPQNGLYQYDGWGFPLNQRYKYMGGTSMAAPMVAGGAAVVRDYYEKVHTHAASAALVKASLINAAVDLLDENNDGVNDNAFPIPNIHEGWGRVDLIEATDGSHQYVDETIGLSTGNSTTFTFPLATGNLPLKITLAWTDYPSSASAARNLVNDLDLTVTAPDGTAYSGNAFARGWSIPGITPDRTNNVENVYVLAAAAGMWTIKVSGFNVPNGPQPFALVMDVLDAPIRQQPFVTITAADATATEAGVTTGQFRVSRTGDVTSPLVVAYTVSGTATAGSDYVALPGTVTIAGASAETTFLLEPLDDALAEADETVVVTLQPGDGFALGGSSSAVVKIISDDTPPDLLVTGITVPAIVTNGTITVSDTTRNQGSAPATASETGFYLSLNTSLDAADIFLGSRAVPALAAGVSHTQSSVLPIPATVAPGTYFVLAIADWNGAIMETQEYNNLRAGGPLKIGPDLLVSALTASASAAAGGPVVVNDTTQNQGGEPAASSVTTFYLSLNTALDSSDILLGGRAVSPLAAATSQAASTTFTIPASTATGFYYVLAVADANGNVAESLENNNSRIGSAVRVGADLTISSVTAPFSAAAGSAIVVGETTRNDGGGPASSSLTAFYLSLNQSYEAADTLLGNRAVPALAAGASSVGSTSLTIPASMAPGTYYIVLKADAGSEIAETSESNNFASSAAIKLGPDLILTYVSAAAVGAAGEPIAVTDSIRNQGGAPAPASESNFYLSANATFDAADVLIGTRAVATIAAGTTNTGSVSLVIPAATATGSYYIFEQLDAGNTVNEALENNNVGRSSTVRIGPDLTIATFTAQTPVIAGSSVTVNDTTSNTGGGPAATTVISFYLSNNITFDAGDQLLGSRTVPALAGGASHSAATTLPLPSTAAAGNYYIFAVADSGRHVVETTEDNNTRVVGVRINAP